MVPPLSGTSSLHVSSRRLAHEDQPLMSPEYLSCLRRAAGRMLRSRPHQVSCSGSHPPNLRQQFERGERGFKVESAPLFKKIGQIFANDRASVGLSAAERAGYHREQSGPIVDAIGKYAHDQLTTNRKAEPNGAFAKRLKYFLNNLTGLKTFLVDHGVPLTTNFAEGEAKFSKQHNRNSLSLQTERGALVGAFFMNLIAGCKGVGRNPLDYLTAMIRWRHAINSEIASEWLPQCYETAIPAAEKAHRPKTVLAPSTELMAHDSKRHTLVLLTSAANFSRAACVIRHARRACADTGRVTDGHRQAVHLRACAAACWCAIDSVAPRGCQNQRHTPKSLWTGRGLTNRHSRRSNR